MIGGLPWASWLLLVLSVGIGLAIEWAFYRAHATERRDRLHGRDPSDPEAAP